MQNTNWNFKTIDFDRVFFNFSQESITEFNQYLKTVPKVLHVDELKIDRQVFPNILNDLIKLTSETDSGQRFVVTRPIPNLTEPQIEIFHWVLSNLLGETIVQNEEGRHLIHIYDRDPKRRIKDGARYHQTHETGSIHTDNVNIPENYQYLLVGCVSPAMIGGENIIVSGQSVFDFLKEKAPNELKILMENFCFEYRGISRELYDAPIITMNKLGEPLYRHLRTYMESAHARANKPLNDDQVRALDALDATLGMSQFQLLYRLNKGEILVANDSQILHDRRSFVDAADTITLDEHKNGKVGTLKRTLLRTWVRKV